MQSVLCSFFEGDSQTLRDNVESNVHFGSENKLLQENIFSYIKAQAVVRHLQFVQSPYFSTVPHGRLFKIHYSLCDLNIKLFFLFGQIAGRGSLVRLHCIS